MPALAVQPLLAALRQPAYVTGNMQVQADLHGAGATPHAIAASLDGSLGARAWPTARVDNRLLGSTLGSILREINLLDLVGRGGTSQVQCFAARLDANHGIATVRSLVLASSLLTMDGDGSVNLGAETLDLRVRPQAQAGRHRPCRAGAGQRAVPRRRPPRPTPRRRSPRMPEPWRARCWATRHRSACRRRAGRAEAAGRLAGRLRCGAGAARGQRRTRGRRPAPPRRRSSSRSRRTSAAR